MVLTGRALGRALLARQLLLERSPRPALDAIEHLVGMQSQAPQAPYVGLWTRLVGFRPDELSGLMTERRAVRIACLRGTIHLVSAADCGLLRPVTQPVLDRVVRVALAPRLAGVDTDRLAARGRALVEEKPLTFQELGALLRQEWPVVAAGDLTNAVRALVPLVQTTPRGVWRSGGASRHTTVEAWLGAPLPESPGPDGVLLRYLAAYGPASAADAQAWSGLSRLREVFDRLAPRLRTFTDEQSRTLYDLPDAPRPDPDTQAPVRFLPEFDNLLLSHADRTRVISDAHRAVVFTVNGQVRGTVLVDGTVAATWKLTRPGGVLRIGELRKLTAREAAAVRREAARLLDFALDPGQTRDIQLVPAVAG